MAQALTFGLRIAKSICKNFSLILISFLSPGMLIGLAHAHTQTLAEAAQLELGKSIERELAGGEQHHYQITLNQGQYANILVGQNGVNVAVKLLGSDGKVVAEFDNEERAQGKETVEVVADTTGNYRLTVEAAQRNARGRYEIQVVTLREATEKDRQLYEARKSFTASGQLRRAGNLSESFKLAERALEIRERELGPEHIEVAYTLDTVAFFYFRKGDFGKAEALMRRVVAIKEKTLEPNHPEIAQSLNSLGLVMEGQGDLGQAEELYKRALEIRERTFGPDHTAVAASLNSLAGIYMEYQEYAKAEPLYQRSLELKERLLGPDNVSVADALNNLALVSRNLGDYAKAEERSLGALAIYEKKLGPDHPSLTTALINLALVYNEKEDYGKSETALRRALEIAQKKLEAGNPTIAKVLYNLGNVYFYQDDLARAEPLYQQALDILEKRLGPNHPDLAYSLRSLGGLYRLKGDYDKAESYFRHAYELREKAFGPNHPSVGETLSSLTTLYAARGDAAQAVRAETRVNELTEHNVALNLVSGSDFKKVAYLASLSEKADHTITLGVRTFPENSAARQLAATAVLLRKGRVQDVLADSLRTLRSRFDEQDKRVFDELRRVTAQLAQLVLNGPQQITVAEHQARIQKLEEQREKLEDEISRRTAGYYQKSQPVSLAAVQRAVPADTALVEFTLYRPFDPKSKTKEKELGEPRYAVYVLRQQGEVQFKDLGEARPLDLAIDHLRAALRDPKRKDAPQLARVVDEKIMQPVRPLAGDAAHLLISPDGSLNLLPFEALVDERGRYLLERYAFSYLTSGRDLLRLQVARENKSEPVVVAAPLFGEPTMAQVAAPGTQSPKPGGRTGRRQSITTGTDMANVYFAPLGGTAQEAQTIKSLFADAEMLTAAAASESVVKQLQAPKILHIATHGFFLTDEAVSTTSRAGARAINAKVKIDNPLLRSGLALAGANLKGQGGEDGILTALEASGLNLWGTKLVTLSACDTGVGEVRNGEGVYGLRRAFLLAGAESLVMSLWPVSDYVTREIMTAYYKNLKQGLGRGEALRQVQLVMLKHKGREHPFYWASFIQAGEWANLDGKRK
jgi:CHAT domain-containing protein/Tfp pilus assembly protein PilF